jgi:hypothetical protein
VRDLPAANGRARHEPLLVATLRPPEIMSLSGDLVARGMPIRLESTGMNGPLDPAQSPAGGTIRTAISTG